MTTTIETPGWGQRPTGTQSQCAPAGSPRADSDNVERTSRDTTWAQWGVAAVVMVGSAASAGIGFAHVGGHLGYAAVGVITGLGVDLALAYSLIIGRRLRALGVTTKWGTALTWITGVMALCLNSGAAALTGRWVLAVAHAFLPVLLVVLCEAGSEAQLKLLRLRQQRYAEELAVEQAAAAAERRRLDAERQAEQDRDERARADRALARELAGAQHERDVADRREAREHEARQAVASLAAVLTLGAALRRRPSRPSQRRPSRTQLPVPAARPRSVPVTEALLSQARRVRAERLSQGKTAGRSVLQRELGVSERTAKELVRQLDGQPLRMVPGGGS